MTRQRLGALARGYWFDALLVVGVGVGLVETVFAQDDQDGPQGPLWFDLLAVVAMTLPLFARRRFPFAAPVAVGVVVAAISFVDNRFAPYGLVPILVVLAAFVWAGTLRDRRRAVAVLAIGIGVDAIATYNDPLGSDSDVVFTGIIFTVAWTTGFALSRKFQEADEARQRAERAKHEREERARAAVADERARIARELHDVVGHSVSVMTVQAAAVRRRLRPGQEKQRDALLVVEQTGRDALAEMRRMVGVLRGPEGAS